MSNEPKTLPQRIQRRRSAGWKAPLDANGLPPVYVGRGSKFGNPWKVGAGICHARDAEDAVRKFKRMAASNPELLAAIKAELPGRNVMCWCALQDKDGKPVPCHANYLLELANQDGTP